MKKKFCFIFIFLIFIFCNLAQVNYEKSSIEIDKIEESKYQSACPVLVRTTDDILLGGILNSDCSFGCGGGGGGSFGSAVAGTVGMAIAGAAYYGASSHGSIGGVSIDVTPTWSGSTSSTSNTSYESEIQKFVKSFLENEKNTYGWTEDELKETLNQAMNITQNGELVKVDKYPDEQFKVYLGIFTKGDDSYEKIAQKNEGAACFYMEDAAWDYLANKKQKDMWILNKLFLEYVISKNCIFVLTKDPKKYFNGKDILEDRSYSDELRYIWNRGYTWDTGHTKDMMEVGRNKK